MDKLFAMPLARVLCVTLALTMVGSAAPPEVLLRLDDVGMNHSVNAAIDRVGATGMPFSVSLMAVGPKFDEAVAILKKHPQVAVGVHLALNAEWHGYRWGPVLGKAKVPSLVDADGYFLPSVDAFLASKYDLGEVEREMTAQLERALASGLKISYVDAHMGTWVTRLTSVGTHHPPPTVMKPAEGGAQAAPAAASSP